MTKHDRASYLEARHTSDGKHRHAHSVFCASAARAERSALSLIRADACRRVTGFPFSVMPHPQYCGVCFTVIGVNAFCATDT
eukprot:6185993-Pleurochrysis_carterae.AAC.3